MNNIRDLDANFNSTKTKETQPASVRSRPMLGPVFVLNDTRSPFKSLNLLIASGWRRRSK